MNMLRLLGILPILVLNFDRANASEEIVAWSQSPCCFRADDGTAFQIDEASGRSVELDEPEMPPHCLVPLNSTMTCDFYLVCAAYFVPSNTRSAFASDPGCIQVSNTTAACEGYDFDYDGYIRRMHTRRRRELDENDGIFTAFKCDSLYALPDANGNNIVPDAERNVDLPDVPFSETSCEIRTATCSRCEVGYYLNGAQTCSECDAGHECDGYEMAGCAPGFYSEPRSPTCDPCPAGTISTSVGSEECVSCPPGTAPDASRTKCDSCGLGTFSSAGISCETCADGTYAEEIGRSVCSECESGTKCISGRREACLEGTYARNGSTTCDTCAQWSESDCAAGSEYLHGCGQIESFTFPSVIRTCENVFHGEATGGTETQIADQSDINACKEAVLSQYATASAVVYSESSGACFARFGSPYPIRPTRTLFYCIIEESVPEDAVVVNATTPGSCVPCTDFCPSGSYMSQSCEVGAISDDTICRSCDVCDLHSFRSGCEGSQPGTCEDCSFNTTSCPSGQYLSSFCDGTTTNDVSECTQCAPCGAGEYRSGCEGSSPGTCVSCTTACSSGEWLSASCDGTGTEDTSSCQLCGLDASGAQMCSAGQFLDGCGSDGIASGTCVGCATECPTPNQYMTATCDGTTSADVQLGSCTDCPDSSCGAGQTLQGCGGFSAGTCVDGCACAMDEHCTSGDPTDCSACAHTPTSCVGSQYLAQRCDGSLTADTSVCVDCPVCDQDQYRAGCGNEKEGVCVPCTVIGDCLSSGTQYVSNRCDGTGTTNTASCISCDAISCPSGQFLHGCGGYDAGECRDCSVCPGGQYASGCGGIDDATCLDCEPCGADEYRSGCGGTNPGVCVPCQTCASNEYVRNGTSCAGNSLVDSVECVPCPSAGIGAYRLSCTQYSAGLQNQVIEEQQSQRRRHLSEDNANSAVTFDCEHGTCAYCKTSCEADNEFISDTCDGFSFGVDPTTCVACPPCKDEQMYRVGCSGHSIGYCKATSVCKSGIEYEVSPPTAFSDRVCACCSRCEVWEYAHALCNATHDTQCAPLTECGPGEYESIPPTENSDRECLPSNGCDSNTTFEFIKQTPETPSVCLPVTTCDPHFTYETVPPTISSDRVCSQKTQCSNREYIADPGTTTTDRRCASLTICEDEEFEEVPFGATNDRRCTPCGNYTMASIVATYGNSLPRIVDEWTLRCYDSDESDVPWLIIALAILLSSVFFFLGCVLYNRRFHGDIAIHVGDQDGDNRVDVSDVVDKFDLNRDGYLSVEETEALVQYTKDSVQRLNSPFSLFCPCLVPKPKVVRVVKRAPQSVIVDGGDRGCVTSEVCTKAHEHATKLGSEECAPSRNACMNEEKRGNFENEVCESESSDDGCD